MPLNDNTSQIAELFSLSYHRCLKLLSVDAQNNAVERLMNSTLSTKVQLHSAFDQFAVLLDWKPSKGEKLLNWKHSR